MIGVDYVWILITSQANWMPILFTLRKHDIIDQIFILMKSIYEMKIQQIVSSFSVFFFCREKTVFSIVCVVYFYVEYS